MVNFFWYAVTVVIAVLCCVFAADEVNSNDFVENHGALFYDQLNGEPYEVDYDYRAIRINGKRIFLQSAGIHYPRSSPSMWPQMMAASRAAGMNTIQTYVFHNYHEYEQGVWDWETENRNLGAFLQAAADAGMFVNLRIGPYVCAEWFYGGIPLWAHDQGYAFRNYNPGWLNYMQSMMTKVVEYVRPYLARNGGPIILTQIENEFGAAGSDPNRIAYVQWCGNLTQTLNTGTVWVMCQQPDAPLPTIYTCNGDDCSGYVQNQQSIRQQPAMWTENWIGWFQHWGETLPTRDTRNIAYDSLSFYAKGGSYMNYYMWQGGSNFGRTGGGPNIITSYDYDGAIDEYGVPHEPKYTHSARMHAVLANYASTMMGYNFSLPQQLGNGVELYTYGLIGKQYSVAFLRNTNSSALVVTWNDQKYSLAGSSVSIVDGLMGIVVYDSNDISDIKIPTPPTNLPSSKGSDADIVSYSEPIGIWSKDITVADSPIEQLYLTSYKTIYLWYSTKVQLNDSQIKNGFVTLGLSNAGDHEYFYLDSTYLGRGDGCSSLTGFKLNVSSFQPGSHVLNILSLTLGLNNGADSALARGLNGDVQWDSVSILNQTWSHQVGTLGEYFRIYTDAGQHSIPWQKPQTNVPLTWYKIMLPTPTPVGDASVATWQFDMSGLGKGELWCNGFMVGPYWSIKNDKGGYTQQYYHIPRDYLKPAGELNLVVMLEEIGSNPENIVLAQRNAGTVNAVSSE